MAEKDDGLGLSLSLSLGVNQQPLNVNRLHHPQQQQQPQPVPISHNKTNLFADLFQLPGTRFFFFLFPDILFLDSPFFMAVFSPKNRIYS